jgi:N-acetylmuramoyl-L-alanine amidase
LLTNITERVKVLLIAIDAGHGGRDTGAVANGLEEKDITLQLLL